NQDSETTTTTTIADTGTDKLITLPPDTSHTSTPGVAYIPDEGDVSYRSRKLKVWRNNGYIETDKDVTLDGGIVVKRNGEVVKNGKTRKLREGESVNKAGDFFNQAGEKIEDAWAATKTGLKKAAKAVENAGEKAGKKVKDAVH